MGDFQVKFDDAKLVDAGIIELFKSSGMQSALQEAADSIASSANSMASSMTATSFEEASYEASVKVLSRTAIGDVSSTHMHAHVADAKHHILNSLNH